MMRPHATNDLGRLKTALSRLAQTRCCRHAVVNRIDLSYDEHHVRPYYGMQLTRPSAAGQHRPGACRAKAALGESLKTGGRLGRATAAAAQRCRPQRAWLAGSDLPLPQRSIAALSNGGAALLLRPLSCTLTTSLRPPRPIALLPSCVIISGALDHRVGRYSRDLASSLATHRWMTVYMIRPSTCRADQGS